MRRSLFVLVLVFTFAGFANAQSTQEEVMMKMLTLKNALMTKDSVTLSNILADDVTYGHSTGVVQTKAELIHSVMSGEQVYKSIEPSDMNVRVYNNTGVVTLKLKMNVVASGTPAEISMTATFTWVKINNNWKLVARQSARLPG